MPKRILEGVVVSDKGDKTIVVKVERTFLHPVLKKTVRRSKKYHAHDEANVYKAGDVARIICTVSCEGRTGVEMEALTGASVAALTLYDMCKALSHDIVIRDIRLLRKHGGKSDFERDGDAA